MSFFKLGSSRVIHSDEIPFILIPSNSNMPKYLEYPKSPKMTIDLLGSIEYYEAVMSELKRSDQNLCIILLSLRMSVMWEWDKNNHQLIGNNKTPCLFQVNNNLYNVESNFQTIMDDDGDPSSYYQDLKKLPFLKITKNDDTILKVLSTSSFASLLPTSRSKDEIFSKITKKDISEIKSYFFHLFKKPKDIRKLFSD